MKEKAIVNVRDASFSYGVPQRVIQQAINDDEVEVVLVAGKRHVLIESLEGWLQKKWDRRPASQTEIDSIAYEALIGDRSVRRSPLSDVAPAHWAALASVRILGILSQLEPTNRARVMNWMLDWETEPTKTIRQVAAETGVSKSTVHRRMHQ